MSGVTASVVEVAPAHRLVTMPGELPKLTLGWEAVKWASKYLRHPNGPRAGLPWEFVESQVRFFLHWYALDADGEWLFRHGVRRLAKGSGKSPFAAVQALVELCAPVRLDDFDPKAPGGVRGKRVAMPWVQIAATAESQTANTMRMVRAFAPKGSRVVAEHRLDPGKTVIYTPDGGELRVITSSTSSAEGAEATFVVADESEHWKPSNGGPELAATLNDNLAKSGSRMLETCNSWEPGTGSVAEGSWDAWVIQEESAQAVAAGRDPKVRGATRILYDARIAALGTDMRDEESLTAALVHVYGDCWWQTRHLPAIRERIWDPRSRPDDSKRKYLNWPTAAQTAWTTEQAWGDKALVDASRVVAQGEDVVLFFDGSRTRDATGIVGCCLSDGHVFVHDAWEPDPKHTTTDQASAVPTAEVDASVARAFGQYTVWAFFADVNEWDGFVKVTWPERHGDEAQVWAQKSGDDPQPFAWDMRGHDRQFTAAAELMLAEIDGKGFTHDGDSRLARHVVNARRRPNRYGVSVGKETRDSPRKIDLAVCAIGARMVRRIVLASKEWQDRSETHETYAPFRIW